MADLKIVISALNKASNDLIKVKNDISGVGNAGGDAAKGVSGFGANLGSMMTTAALAAGAVVAVGAAIKEVYNSAKEGAELEYAETRFDNLANSIGAVSSALLDDLRDATRGLKSDAELVAGAADFMALGLANSHDEVVRLTTVAGALGMNMNQLVLTLTNKTTMRFDALGVSVDGFQEKVKALEEAGLSADDAFTEAFLQQAEAQIGKVGERADSAAGSFDRFEASSKNLADSLKKSLLPVIAPIVEGLADIMDVFSGAYEPAYLVSDAITAVTQAFNEGRVSQEQYDVILADISRGWTTSADAIAMVTPEVIAVTQAEEDQIMTIFEASKTWDDFTSRMNKAGLEIGMLTEQVYYQEKAQQLAADAAVSASASINSITFGSARGEILETKLVVDSLNGAYGLLATAQAGFAGDIVGKVKLELDQDFEAGKITIEEYTKALETLDSQFGTSYSMEFKLEGKIDDLVKTLLTDPDSFKENVIEVAADFSQLDEEVREAQEAVDLLQKKLFGLQQTYTITIDYGTIGHHPNAVGGAVYGGNPYTWQEYGYRGELFIPSQDGYVLSRAEAERALSRALVDGKSGGGSDAQSIASAVAGAITGAMSTKQAQPAYAGPSAQDIARAVRDGLLMSRVM